MNIQERTLLTYFLQQLSAAQAGQKDAEADALIREAVGRQPDAAYLLVQRAMQLEQAVQALQAQVGNLQAEIDQLKSGSRSGFLDNAWGRSPPASQAMPSGGAQRAAPAAAPAQGGGSAWGSGVLGSIASTAAGVVAGSFLFQGIESLLGHRGGAGLWTSPAQQQPLTENTTINNYYGSDEGASEESSTDIADADTDLGNFDDSSDYA